MSRKTKISSFKSASLRLLNDEENKKLKYIMLQTFLDVYFTCKKNSLTIFLGGGSALGAVRHNGYIPWDDDLDAIMPREDFETFKTIFENELGEKYELNSPNYSEHPSNRFAKILVKNTKFVEIGSPTNAEYNKIKIDIFILENIPSNVLIKYLKGLHCSFLMFVTSCVGTYEARSSFYSKNSKSISDKFRIFVGFLFSLRSYSKWCNRLDKAFQYNKNSRLVGLPSGRKHYFGEIFTRDCFFPCLLKKFEGYDLPIPNKIDKYLTNLYGDYMILPDENKREKHPIIDIDFGNR